MQYVTDEDLHIHLTVRKSLIYSTLSKHSTFDPCIIIGIQALGSGSWFTIISGLEMYHRLQGVQY